MNEYMNKTQEQEFNEIKGWFKANATPILVIIIIFLASYSTWNFYQSYQQDQRQNTSFAYTQALRAFTTDPKTNHLLLEKFATEHRNAYGVFARFNLAQYFVHQQDFAKAAEQLEQAIATKADNNLTKIAQFRLAKVYYEQQHFAKALDQLKALNPNSSDVLELSGDLLVKLDRKDEAKKAYAQAFALTHSPIIQLKLNQLN